MIILLGVCLLSGGIYAHLAQQGDLRYSIVEVIRVYIAALVLYIAGAWIVLNISKPEHMFGRFGWAVILGGAILFRVLAWPLYPALSDDPFRYRWEGKLQAAGGNPYEARPADDAWAGLRDPAYERVAGKEFRGGYGPLTEVAEWMTFEAVSRFVPDPERQVFWFKLPYALFDLAVIWALWLLLRARGMPLERILVYAWCPLAVMEFWGTGHNDSLAVVFVVLAIAMAAGKRWNWAFLALGAGIAAKLWPVVLLPMFIGWKGRRPERWWQPALTAAVVLLASLPYWTNVEENAAFMTGFLSGWRNNDALFGVVLRLAGGDVYIAKRLAIGIVGMVALWVTWRRWPMERACLTVLLALLAVSANCHVWYLTWIIPLLAVVPVTGVFLWMGLMPLAYEVLIRWVTLGEWEGSTPWRWWIHAPFLGWLAIQGLRSIRSAGLRTDPGEQPSPRATPRSADRQISE